VAYGATAARPGWTDLPPFVREAIEDRLDAPVRTATVTGGGFTRGFAAVLSTRAGTRVFVKATEIDYLVVEYRREAIITALLPPAVPAARPRWVAVIDGWFASCFDAIDGRMPALPWRADELAATLDAWAVTAAALAGGGSPLLTTWLPDFGGTAAESFRLWREIDAHRAPLPAMPRYGVRHLGELAALEQRMRDLAAGHRSLMHYDLRLDNVLLDPAGGAWLCDWNHARTGPPWFDTVTLLITAYASGLDADRLFATHPTSADAPPDALDAVLAAVAGVCLDGAGRPSDASPSIAAHKRWTGETALRWLADRRGWEVG
jgi:hypothetical protein